MESAYQISNFYYIIATEHRNRFDTISKKLNELENINDEEKRSIEERHITHDSLKSAVSCIVFCSMCLESFIFAYAEEFLSKSYTKKYLDKLSLDSKFIIIPKLITGEEIDRGGQGFEKLRKLIKDRNEIVHYKSKSEYGIDEDSFLGEDSFLPNSMENGIEAIHTIMNELEEIHPEASSYFLRVVTKAECFV